MYVNINLGLICGRGKVCNFLKGNNVAKDKSDKKKELSLPQKKPVPSSADLMYPKSNIIIRAKYKSSTMEENVFAYAFAHLPSEGRVTEGGIAYTFPTKPLQKMMGKESSTYFYTQIKTLATRMLGHQMLIEYEEGGNRKFDYFNLVTRASYGNGYFTVYFNKDLPLLDVEKSGYYTRLSLRAQLELVKVPAKRLYEILKSHCYTPKGAVKSNPYSFNLSIAQLQLDMGIVDSNEEKVRRILEQPFPDYEKAVEVAEHKTNVGWREFRRRILIPAIEEINEKSDYTCMCVKFTPIASGLGGKYKEINFEVMVLDPSKFKDRDDNLNISEEEASAFIDTVYEMLIKDKIIEKREDLPIDSARVIAKAADYNQMSLQSAIWKVRSSTTKVENPIGYIIDNLKNFYTISQQRMEKLKGIWAQEKAETQGEEVFSQTGMDFDMTLKDDDEISMVYSLNDDEYAEITESESDAARPVPEPSKEPMEEQYALDGGTIAKNVWLRIKKRSEFNEFEKALKKEGLDTSNLELIMDYGELVNLYSEWKKSGTVSI